MPRKDLLISPLHCIDHCTAHTATSSDPCQKITGLANGQLTVATSYGNFIALLPIIRLSLLGISCKGRRRGAFDGSNGRRFNLMANCERATSLQEQLGLQSGEIVNLAESWSNFLQPSTPFQIGSFPGALDPQVSETHNYFLFQTFKQRILC